MQLIYFYHFTYNTAELKCLIAHAEGKKIQNKKINWRAEFTL